MNTQIPSIPPELHATLVLYTEHVFLVIQLDPFEIHATLRNLHNSVVTSV